MKTKNGTYCGESIINGKACQIFINKGHFVQVISDKMQKFLKRSAVRKAGIWIYSDKGRKDLYGKHGYIGV